MLLRSTRGDIRDATCHMIDGINDFNEKPLGSTWSGGGMTQKRTRRRWRQVVPKKWSEPDSVASGWGHFVVWPEIYGILISALLGAACVIQREIFSNLGWVPYHFEQIENNYLFRQTTITYPMGASRQSTCTALGAHGVKKKLTRTAKQKCFQFNDGNQQAVTNRMIAQQNDLFYLSSCSPHPSPRFSQSQFGGFQPTASNSRR